MVERLAAAVVDVTVVPVVERRSENPARVAELFRRYVPTQIDQSATTAIERLLGDTAYVDDVILVAGSLFLVGEARAHLET
jgi:folylpolyglutamate synthase/dihydropteroate synthase